MKTEVAVRSWREYIIYAAAITGLLIGLAGISWGEYDIDKQQNAQIKKIEGKVKALESKEDLTGKVEGLQSEIESLKKALEETKTAKKAEAEEGKSTLNFSGFYDMSWTINPKAGNSDKFNVGALEIDLEMPVSEKISGEAAIVFEGGAADVGVGIIDIHFYDRDESVKHPEKGHVLKHTGLIVGVFDVPFGLDYEEYATPDRKLMSAPLTTDVILEGGWGGTGINTYFNTCCFDVKVYYLDEENLDDSADPHSSIGGTLSIYRTDFGQIGVSAANFMNVDKQVDKSLFGVSLTANLLNVSDLKAEYMAGTDNKLTTQDRYNGYYVQLCSEIEKYVKAPVYVAARYGVWNAEGEYDANGDGTTGNENLGRLAVGGGWNINDNVLLKIEYLTNSEHEDAQVDDDQAGAQLVISF